MSSVALGVSVARHGRRALMQWAVGLRKCQLLSVELALLAAAAVRAEVRFAGLRVRAPPLRPLLWR